MSYNTRRKSTKAVSALAESSVEDLDYSDSGSEYQNSDSSNSTEEDSSEHSSESDASSSDEIPRKLFKETEEIERNKNVNQDKMYIIKSDDYFSNISQRKVVVSNNCLDKLETPRLQQDELQKLLSSKQLMVKHKTNLKHLEKANRQFNKWLYLLHEGFNILLYGLGSKMAILKDFQEKCLKNLPVVVVNGFFPSLSIKSVVESIMSDVLELRESPGNIFDACDIITQELLHMPTMHLYIIVHNIEGDMLKNGKAQTVLSKLATVENLHLIASIDHVSAPLIWDNTKLSKFNFIWCDTTSFMPYSSETSFEGSMVVQRSKTLALSSLNNVFLSLTSNSKGIYLTIVKYQLKNGGSQHYQGFLFKDLYWACREAFLVSSDLALRSQLTEFVDHKMLRFRRSVDGSEYLIIPTATNILQQFFDEQSK